MGAFAGIPQGSDMSAFQLRIEPFAGTSIAEACHEAVRLATELRIIVGFDFNGVHCMAKPDGDAQELARRWDKALESEQSYKVVSA